MFSTGVIQVQIMTPSEKHGIETQSKLILHGSCSKDISGGCRQKSMGNKETEQKAISDAEPEAGNKLQNLTDEQAACSRKHHSCQPFKCFLKYILNWFVRNLVVPWHDTNLTFKCFKLPFLRACRQVVRIFVINQAIEISLITNCLKIL